MLRVITPSFNDDLLDRFLTSLEVSEAGSSGRVIVGDNGLSPACRARWPLLDYVSVPSDPYVMSTAINRCVARTRHDEDLLMLGDDIEMLTPSWLSRVERLLAEWPAEYGLASLAEPSTLSTLGALDVRESPVSIAFVCTVIPRATWNVIGPMDERYTGYGYDDIDYDMRVLHHGLKLGVTGAAVIKHEGTVGYRRRLGSWEAVNEHCLTSYRLFHLKWGLPMPPVPEIRLIPVGPHFKRQGCPCQQ